MQTCKTCLHRIQPGEVQCPDCGAFPDGKVREEARCRCNRLLGNLVRDADGRVVMIEIKCIRCKNVRQIPVDAADLDQGQVA